VAVRSLDLNNSLNLLGSYGFRLFANSVQNFVIHYFIRLRFLVSCIFLFIIAQTTRSKIFCLVSHLHLFLHILFLYSSLVRISHSSSSPPFRHLLICLIVCQLSAKMSLVGFVITCAFRYHSKTNQQLHAPSGPHQRLFLQTLANLRLW